MNRFVLLMAAAACLVASAQEKKKVRTFQIHIDGPAAGEPGDHMFVAGGPGQMMHIEQFQAKAVKGAPYAAEATTESVQTLADGNRIANKNTSKMYRDAEGRTRLENTIAPNAFWVPQGKEFTITVITDPVAGVHYTLNSNDKVAMKMSIPTPPAERKMKFTSEDGKQVNIERNVVVHHAGVAGAIAAGPMPAAGAGPAMMVFERHGGGPVKVPPGDVKREDLGKQALEGVQCEGTRETFVIPAGQMGNEREIRTVTERWYSPELGFDVLRKHSDPRVGETTYRVTRIVMADQPRSLFEVPADYKVEEPKAMNEELVIKRKIAKE